MACSRQGADRTRLSLWEAEGPLDADEPGLAWLSLATAAAAALLSQAGGRWGALRASLPDSDASCWRPRELRGRSSAGLCADPLATGERGPAVGAVAWKESEGTPRSPPRSQQEADETSGVACLPQAVCPEAGC